MEGFLPSRQISKTAEILPFQFCIKIRLDISFLYHNPWIMIGIKRTLTASISMGIWLFSMPSYAEDRFLAKDFLEWDADSRSSYVRISLLTATLISKETNAGQSECLGKWYDQNRTGAEDYIFGVMRKNPDHHPVAIILAVAERKCGSFKYE
ncbi:hypothetical protein FMN50_00455 [Rhodobacterales bacterium]|nr:hypothetical protein FMN50_00455 [Rhodobacterales bacterium]